MRSVLIVLATALGCIGWLGICVLAFMVPLGFVLVIAAALFIVAIWVWGHYAEAHRAAVWKAETIGWRNAARKR